MITFVKFFLVSKVFAVPAPLVNRLIFDIDMVGRNPQLLLEEGAYDFGHALADLGFRGSEELDLNHSDGKIVVAAKPHTAVVGKIEHQPVFAFAGKAGNGFPKLGFED